MDLRERLSSYRVLPVIAVDDAETAVHLCGALAAGGMKAVEITLRTDAALESITAVSKALPALAVGAGTVTGPAALHAAIDAGAGFHVSPGLTPALLAAAAEADADLLPGVATASEVMLGVDAGLDCFKLFPAAAAGGMELLKALAGPFPDVVFCPTGGLNPDNFREFLALDNVVCCGGTWMVAQELVVAQDWERVQALAAEAMS